MSNLGPPFINVPSLANLRDVGGLPIRWSKKPTSPTALASPSHSTSSTSSTSQRVRAGILYRSADPTQIDADGLAILHERLGIRTIFDLRAEPEIANHGGVEEWEAQIADFNRKNNNNNNNNNNNSGSSSSGSGESSLKVKRVWSPVFKAEDYGPESVALRFRAYADKDVTKGFVKAYAGILEHGPPSFALIMRHLAGSGGGDGGDTGSDVGGTLIHCSAGKDRTGVLVAVILSLVGVDDESISAEYELTQQGLAERRPFNIARLVASGAFDDVGGREAAERMTGSRKESMMATLRYIDEKYGGVEAYVTKVCGLSQAEIEALRRRLVGGQAAL